MDPVKQELTDLQVQLENLKIQPNWTALDIMDLVDWTQRIKVLQDLQSKAVQRVA